MHGGCLRPKFGNFHGKDEALKIPLPVTIRAGKAGGLPFDSLTTDLFLGCLPPSRVCYGCCFAARTAFKAGYDFGTRIANLLDSDTLSNDIARLPAFQAFLRNGWNSDPSWSWRQAGKLARLIHDHGKHIIFITKAFQPVKDAEMADLVETHAEIRVSLSAFDTKAQLKHRLRFIERYRDSGGRLFL